MEMPATSDPPRPAARRGSLVARNVPRLFRLGLLAAAAGLIYAAAGSAPRDTDEVSIADAAAFFPETAELVPGDRHLGGVKALDHRGRTLGLLFTTSPHTDDLVGYSGPSNLLIALDSSHKVVGVKLLSSGDTQEHVEQVRESEPFWRQFAGSSPTARPSHIEAVSGSTLTSMAMAEAVERRLRGSSDSLRFPAPVSTEEARQLFPAASKMIANDPRRGWHRVLDHQDVLLGFAVRTSPHSDNVRGYQGPTESLLGVDADGRIVTGVLLRKSFDTEEYVDRVRDDRGFLRLLANRSLADWRGIDFSRAGIEGVSGATQTSYAVSEGIRRRLAADHAAIQSKRDRWRIFLAQPGLLAIIAGGLLLAFTPLKNYRWLRGLWQGILIVAFAVWIGDLVSLSLLAGWARQGIPWRTAPTVVLLVAVALLVPWGTRRQVYCQQLCPHGAAQSWLGRFKRLQIPLSPVTRRWLARIPAATLALGLLLATFAARFELAWLEPFDGWVLKGGAAVSATLAILGLIASVFVPQAYCRYGCPTGELLRMIKSSGCHDTIRRRDALAGIFLLVVAAFLFGPRLVETSGRPEPDKVVMDPSGPAVTQIAGRAFGTTWSVRLRGRPEVAKLQQLAAAELERIESTLSHWRPESYTTQFNISQTTVEMELPAELVALVSRALELSRRSGGAYDITVGPLVDAWGFGPSGPRSSPPTEDELQELRQRTGWEKLIADPAAGTLQKRDPRLQIDLGSLLQGYAADQLGKKLDEAGVEEYLIDVGGELLARGSWLVAVEDPLHGSTPLRTLRLRNRALATSGVYRAAASGPGGGAHHLISPQSGRPLPATAILCSVVAPSALEADAWGTTLLCVGLPGAIPLADEAALAVLLLSPSGDGQTNSLGAQVFGADE